MATEKKQTRDALISAFRHLREQHTALHSLIAEVAALRESVGIVIDSPGAYGRFSGCSSWPPR